MWPLISRLNKGSSILLLRTFTVMTATDLPSTLLNEPVLALTSPGNCQFNDNFRSVPLLKRWDISSTSSVLRFGLPDTSAPLNLSTCACILAKADLPDEDGNMETVVRPYTPISTNADTGFFDLLVKNYGEHGRMSTHLCNADVGAEIDFKHIEFNVKIQAPFPYKRVAMLVGGTGITPMIQALHAILADPTSDIEATMLYGSRDSSDILGKELLDSWVKESDRLSVTHVMSHEPDDSDWKGARGHIDKDLVAKHLPPPGDKESIIFICGPPPMYDVLTGPREDKEQLSGLLHEMGYTAEQVYKF